MQLPPLIINLFIPAGLVAIFRPLWLLYLFLIMTILPFVPNAFVAFGKSFEMFRIGSVKLYLHDYLILIMILISLKSWVQERQRFLSVLKTPLARIIIVFFLWEVFIGFLSHSKGFTVFNVLRNLSSESLMFIAVLVPLAKLSAEDREKLFRFSVYLGGLLVLFGILKYAVFHEIQMTSSGTARSLNGKAMPLLLLPLCYTLFHRDTWQKTPCLSGLFILIIALGINLTGHRSGFIVLLFVLGMRFVRSANKVTLAWIPLWSIALGLMIVIGFFNMNVRAGTFFGDVMIRISDTFNMQNKTTDERLDKWKLSLDVLKENPVLGLGRYPLYTSHIEEGQRALANSLPMVMNRPAHNVFATRLIYEGLAGFSLLLIFFYVLLRQLKRAPLAQGYGNFLRVYMLSFLLFSFFNATFDSASTRIAFFIAVGLLNEAILATRQPETAYATE